MARDNYNDVITRVVTTTLASGEIITYLQPISGVRVTVYKILANGNRDTATSNLFAARSGSAPQSNPFTTQSNGQVAFWADAGDYDVDYADTVIPARIGPQTIGWQAVPGADQGIPSSFLPESGRGLNPPGVMKWYGGITEPAGYLFCDGRLVDRATYPGLFGAISTRYNLGGESAAQFRLPDYRGRINLGPDDFGTTGASGRITQGNKSHGQVGGNELHSHTGTANAHTHTAGTLGAASHRHGVTSMVGLNNGQPTMLDPVAWTGSSGQDQAQVSSMVIPGNTRAWRFALLSGAIDGYLQTEVYTHLSGLTAASVTGTTGTNSATALTVNNTSSLAPYTVSPVIIKT